MAIKVTSDETGVDVKAKGEVGDIFAEGLTAITHLASDFKEKNIDLACAFVDYTTYFINKIVDDEEYDYKELLQNVFRIIRCDPEKAIELHQQIFEKEEDDKMYAYVLLAINSEFRNEEE